MPNDNSLLFVITLCLNFPLQYHAVISDVLCPERKNHSHVSMSIEFPRLFACIFLVFLCDVFSRAVLLFMFALCRFVFQPVYVHVHIFRLFAWLHSVGLSSGVSSVVFVFLLLRFCLFLHDVLSRIVFLHGVTLSFRCVFSSFCVGSLNGLFVFCQMTSVCRFACAFSYFFQASVGIFVFVRGYISFVFLRL